MLDNWDENYFYLNCLCVTGAPTCQCQYKLSAGNKDCWRTSVNLAPFNAQKNIKQKRVHSPPPVKGSLSLSFAGKLFLDTEGFQPEP